jgi:hypothetical protein
MDLDVVFDSRQFLRHTLRRGLVIPQVWFGGLKLQFAQAGPFGVEVKDTP